MRPRAAPFAAGSGHDHDRERSDSDNYVFLRGRLADDAVVRELPSGDLLATFRLTVGRLPAGRVRVDSVECATDVSPGTADPGARCPGRPDRGHGAACDGASGAHRPGRPAATPSTWTPCGHACWSARRRITKPEAGFGVNSVDLRGIRAPAAATAATAATGVGRSSTATPSAVRGHSIASSTCGRTPPCRRRPSSSHTRSTRPRCSDGDVQLGQGSGVGHRVAAARARARRRGR